MSPCKQLLFDDEWKQMLSTDELDAKILALNYMISSLLYAVEFEDFSIQCVTTPGLVTCPQCRRVLERRADIRVSRWRGRP